jgi:hypothetical protein
LKNRFPTLALFAIAALGTARAELLTLSSYNVTLADGMPDVTRIMMLEESADSSSLTWAFSAAGGSTTFLQNPFVHSSPITTSLLIGLVEGLPLDASANQKHLVLFMDSTTAAASANIAWGTLFLNTDEDQLIANLELATSGLPFEDIGPGVDAIFAFGSGDAKNIPGSLGPVSAWFNVGSSFSVMAFSDGTVIGTSESFNTLTPEPGTSVLVFTALVIAGVAIRRRTHGTDRR